jgi:hypothetical protein
MPSIGKAASEHSCSVIELRLLFISNNVIEPNSLDVKKIVKKYLGDTIEKKNVQRPMTIQEDELDLWARTGGFAHFRMEANSVRFGLAKRVSRERLHRLLVDNIYQP